jgi:coiled-coil domain-containing protein 61
MSAFAKDSESVFIDLLTYSDLEMLKARKIGNSSTSSVSVSASQSLSASSNRSHLKRYLILTYKGEFDRVHYPLPLSFEEIPNTDALKRTIHRLRRQIEDIRRQGQEPSSDRERYLFLKNIKQSPFFYYYAILM